MANILIVDDQPINRTFLTTLLGYAGHQLHEAADGAEALEVVRRARPDLVIADVLMPRMDGYEFVRRLRADPAIAHTPVIFYTATYLEREAQALAHDCGVEKVLTKPAPPDLILGTVASILARGPLVPAPAIPAPPTDAFERAHTRLLTDKLATKVDELTTVNNRLAALLDLGQRLAAERDPAALLQIGCDAARTIIGAGYAALDVRSPEESLISHFHTSGMSPAVITVLGEPPTQRGLFAQLIADGHALRTRDIRTDPRATGFPPGHPVMTSFLCVPFASASWRYGMLYLANKLDAEEFRPEDQQMAATLTSQLAIAYENAQRYDALQRHAAALDQEIAERRQVEAQRDQLLAQEQLARAVAERVAERIARLQAVTAACSEALTLDQVTDLVMDQGIALPGAASGLIALLTDDGAALQIVRSRGYIPDIAAKWQSIPLDTPVPIAEAARTGEPIWLESFAALKEHYPQMATPSSSSFNSQALIALPLIAQGQVLGSIGLSFAKARAFTAEDRAFTVALAYQYAQAIDRAQLYQETQAAAQRAEEALALLESLVQAAPVGFAFVDDQLRYRMINANLAALNGAPIEAHIGRTVSEMLPEMNAELEPSLRHVLSSGDPILNKEVSGTTAATGRENGHWLLSYYLVRTRSGHALGLGAIVNDISARKRAEDRQATQFAVTRIIAEAENRYDAVPALLRTICRGVNWDLGEFWYMNPEKNLLCWENDWCVPEFDGSSFAITRHSATFARGSGLPGRVWASSQPEWVANIVATSSARAALALAAGFHSAFAFPIFGGDTLLGVMVFFSRDLQPPDPDLLITLVDIGSQIGQFFERAQAEERLWQYTQRLKTLHMIDQAILAAQSPEAIAQASLRFIRELAPCRTATVTAFDFATGQAIILAIETSAVTPFQRGSHVPLDTFVSLPQLQQGLPFIMEDLLDLSDPAAQQLAMRDGIRSYLSVPIISQHRLIGSLNLFSDRPRAFVPEAIDIAREVGSQLAVALQNAQLFEQVQAGAESLRLMSQQLVRAQEDERRHIARELHDEVGQSLTATLLNLQILSSLTDLEDLPGRLDDSIRLIERVLHQVRTLSLNLRPALLDDLGLAPALRWLVSRQSERASFSAQFNADGMDERFAADIEITCFRAVQEAITNIVRYAQAQNVIVDLCQRDAELCVSICDDGVGFDVAAAFQRAARAQSMGLLSMQERVRLLGGRMRIESALDHGTMIEVCLPLAPPMIDVPTLIGSNRHDVYSRSARG